MFNPKTPKIKSLALKYPDRIRELETFFDKATNVYIDYANVKHWSDKLGWHIDLKRLKRFLDSFDTVKVIKFYNGTLMGDSDSIKFMGQAISFGFDVHTKPVKMMNLSIDVSSISPSSPDILKNFIRRPLFSKMESATIEFLNAKLKDLNAKGVLSIEDFKCNFDVEIGRDMLLDYEKNGVENFALWSGDSDFADPVAQLLKDGKKTILFATARRVSSELNELRKNGLFIYDIQKIKDFICWNRDITP